MSAWTAIVVMLGIAAWGLGMTWLGWKMRSYRAVPHVPKSYGRGPLVGKVFGLKPGKWADEVDGFPPEVVMAAAQSMLRSRARPSIETPATVTHTFVESIERSRPDLAEIVDGSARRQAEIFVESAHRSGKTALMKKMAEQAKETATPWKPGRVAGYFHAKFWEGSPR